MVELLVTTSLMALVGGATVATFSAGMRVWERATTFGVGQQASLLALDEIRRDLQNVRRFEPLPFRGSYDRYEFATVERDRSSSAEEPAELGRLGVFLDERRGVLCRSFVPYRVARRARLTDRCQVMLEGVRRVRFRYFGTDQGRGTTDWFERWGSADPPAAVTCEITVEEHRQRIPYTLLVYLEGTSPNEDANK